MKISKECRNIPESKDYLAFLQSYDAVGLRLNIDFFSFKKTKIYICLCTLYNRLAEAVAYLLLVLCS